MPVSAQTEQALRSMDEAWFAQAQRQSPAAERMARAIEADDAEGVRLALSEGLPVDSKGPVQAKGLGTRGYPATWLEHALVRREPKVAAVEALLAGGADPLQPVSQEDHTPAVLAAVAMAKPEVIEAFRRHGPALSAFAPADAEGWGPLAHALGGFGIPELPLSHPAHGVRQALVQELIASGGDSTPSQRVQVVFAAVSSALPAILETLRPLGIQLEEATGADRQRLRKQAELVESVWGDVTRHDPTTRTRQPVRPDKGQGWLDVLDALPAEPTATPRRRRAP